MARLYQRHRTVQRRQPMKVRDIRISIKTKEDLFNEVKGIWERLEKGEQVQKHEGISFENIEAMRKILSEERLRILTHEGFQLEGERHMSTKEYKDCCKGCDISREFEKKLGGIVELDGGWIVNHYAGPEGFLGWLALQPRYHKEDFASLEKNETEALGRNIQNIDMALRQYWSIRFPEDPIEKVYLVYFHESEEYHLHIHIIPRSRKLGQDNPSEKAAWKICTLAPCWNNFPEEYRLRAKETKGNDNLIHKEEVVALMTYLKGYLWVISGR